MAQYAPVTSTVTQTAESGAVSGAPAALAPASTLQPVGVHGRDTLVNPQVDKQVEGQLLTMH